MSCFKLWISLGFWSRRLVGHDFINCWALDVLFCPIHKILIICEKIFLVSSQTDNPGFSLIMYHSCIVTEQVNLSKHDQNKLGETFNCPILVSYVTHRHLHKEEATGTIKARYGSIMLNNQLLNWPLSSESLLRIMTLRLVTSGLSYF